MVPRRTALLAVLGALVSLLAVPALAAPADGILIRGSRTAYVDLYVYVNTTIAPGDLEMTTKGSYVGFFLSPAPANRDTVGALVMPRVGADEPTRIGQSWDVRAGKYRMFLLTDGPAEVFVPIEGQGFRGWTVTRPAPLSVRPVSFDVDAGAGEGSRGVSLNVRDRALVVAAARATSTSLTAVDFLSVCVPPVTSCAGAVPRLPLSEVAVATAHLGSAGSYAPFMGVTRTGGIDAGSHVDGVVMVLTIGRQT